MDVTFETKFVIVFTLCVCPVVLFIYMPTTYSRNRKVNHIEKFERPTATAKHLDEKLSSSTKKQRIADFITYGDPKITSLRNLLSVCVKAVQLGGKKLQEIRKKYDVDRYNEIKNPVNPLLLGSHNSYKAMYYILKKSFPELKIISEVGYNKEFHIHGEELPELPWIEFDDASEDVEVATKDILVWIDPLDGSRDFQANNLEYVTTMACVAIKGKPVIGVIHQPFENVTMWGWDEKGVSNDTLDTISLQSDTSFPILGLERKMADDFQNYVRLMYGHDATMMFFGGAVWGWEGVHYSNATLGSISKHSDASCPVLITSSMHAAELQIDALNVLQHTVEVIPASGAGYKILQLAVGNVDAYIHPAPIKKWDLCAGNAIIKALDGNMTRFNGKVIDYGNHSETTLTGGVFGTISFHENYFDLTASTNSTSYDS